MQQNQNRQQPKRKKDWFFIVLVIIAIIGVWAMISGLTNQSPENLSYAEFSQKEIIGEIYVEPAGGQNYGLYEASGEYKYQDGTKEFTIAKREITLTAGSATKPYDGTPLTSGDVTVTVGSLAAGHTYEVTINGSITEVGSVENVVENSVKAVTGYFSSAENSYIKQINRLDSKIEKANAAVATYKSRLEQKFQYMDMMISKMQEQFSTFLGT